MAYPRFVRSRQIKKARRTSGNLTLNSTSWANVDTGLDLVLNEVQVGDEIIYGLSAFLGNESVELYLDVATVVSGTPSRSFGEAGPVVASPGVQGVQAWWTSSGFRGLGGMSMPYTVVAGDIVDGEVTLRLRYATGSAANKTMQADANSPLDVWAMNLGPMAE